MARRTATDFVAEVRDNFGGETAETISNTRILRFVNDAYLDIASDYKFSQLNSSTTITTSSGTASYEVTVSDILNIEEMVDSTNSIKLYPLSESQYHMYTQGGTTSGTPIYWFQDGVGANNRFQYTLYPTPAGTYTITIHYQKVPTELVLSPTATSSILPQVWDGVIVARATWSAINQLGDTEAAFKWLQISGERENRAKKSGVTASWVPVYTGSIVGRSTR